MNNKYNYQYTGFPRELIKVKGYTLKLKRPSNKPHRAGYQHIDFFDDGETIKMIRYTDINDKPMPLDRNKKGESTVYMVYNQNGNKVEEGFATYVWSGIFKREWIISKINYYDDKGNYLESNSFLS